MQSIVDVASKYFTLKRNSQNSWIIDGDKFNSVVLFEDTNTYHRFSSGETGNIYKFLRNIVGLRHEDCQEFEQGDVEQSLLEVLRKSLKSETKQERSGYDFEEFIGKVGYNAYMQSRNINIETAKYYNLEIDGPDVIFPLYDYKLHRVGSIRRFANAQNKADRYRTFLLHGHEKPCIWDFREIEKLSPDKIVVLVEGTWSAMRIKQVVGHLPIIPLATMGAEIKLEVFDYIYESRIIAILDNDTGGERYKKQLRIARKRGIMIQEVELNNNGQNIYVDDLTDKQMLKLFRNIV